MQCDKIIFKSRGMKKCKIERDSYGTGRQGMDWRRNTGMCGMHDGLALGLVGGFRGVHNIIKN